MEQSMDKLRDKTLSFGCMVMIKKTAEGENVIGTILEYCSTLKMHGKQYRVMYYLTGMYRDTIFSEDDFVCIGHPLTRGRLCYLSDYITSTVVGNGISVFMNIHHIFNSDYKLYDQDETQQMKHEKRPELKKLLEEFANLLPDSTE